MRRLISLVLFAAVPAQAGMWTAACRDQQVQYQQITGAEGYLHVAKGDGSFATVKLKQSFLSDTMVCGAVPAKVADNETAVICADNEHQTLRVIRGAQLAKGMKPTEAPVLCQAVVNSVN